MSTRSQMQLFWRQKLKNIYIQWTFFMSVFAWLNENNWRVSRFKHQSICCELNVTHKKNFGPGKRTISPFQQLEHISPRYNGWSHALTKHCSAFSSGADWGNWEYNDLKRFLKHQDIITTAPPEGFLLTVSSLSILQNWAILYYLKLQLYTYCCSNSVSCVAYV